MNKEWIYKNKIIISIVGFIIFLVIIAPFVPKDKTSEEDKSETTRAVESITETSIPSKPFVSKEPTLKPTKIPVKTTNTPIPAQTKQSASASNETVSQKNAVRKAKSYLSFSGFSRDGLVAQLEYEKFSHEEAVYGADNSGANWNEQAAKKAKSYMEMTAFSRGGLIDQLKYDKFTQEQAEYGANAVGL